MQRLARLDHRHVWHPFTQMQEWLQREPIVLVSGRGATVRDASGRQYLVANSSIWTNLHGHRQPQIDTALRQQLSKIAHTSALGLANAPASQFAAALVSAVNRLPLRASLFHRGRGSQGEPRSACSHLAMGNAGVAELFPPNRDRMEIAPAPSLNEQRAPLLNKVFFSDNGSTAVEVALKLAYEHARRSGRSRAPRFLGLQGAYHGDTIGATSLGHIDLFHATYRGLLFKSDAVMAPYCYRCPYNRARPETADARTYRRCHWECVDRVEAKFAAQKKRASSYVGFIYEPRMQGAAGMIPQPEGWLSRVAEIARSHGAMLIADEVMTGFGRTGIGPAKSARSAPLWAGQIEGVTPDFLCLAKGLTGGYLPMAATLTTDTVFNSFLGDYGDYKTFFHGHSYTANQLGAAAGRASLSLLQSSKSFVDRKNLERQLTAELANLWDLPQVGDIRQVGLVVGIELVRERSTRLPFAPVERAGFRVCDAMSRRGVLTRAIGDVIVLMPPYCTQPAQVRRMVRVLHDSIAEVLGE